STGQAAGDPRPLGGGHPATGPPGPPAFRPAGREPPHRHGCRRFAFRARRRRHRHHPRKLIMPATSESASVLHSTALYTSAAQALASMLPTASAVEVKLHSGSRHDWVAAATGAMLCATYVGEQSAD